MLPLSILFSVTNLALVHCMLDEGVSIKVITTSWPRLDEE